MKLTWENKEAIKSALIRYEIALGRYPASDELRDNFVDLIANSIDHDLCDLYTVDEMREMFADGSISFYDGHGYWLDEDFNKIAWISYNPIPEKAVWADWYNK